MKHKILIILLLSILSLKAQSLESFQNPAPAVDKTFNLAGNVLHFKSDGAIQKKSPGKAFFFSLILPGSGQYYAGEKQYAVGFFSSEILFLLGLFANEVYTNHLVDEYKTYAVQHAAVQRNGKDIEYWAHIGKYDDIYACNEQRQRERYFDNVYEDNQANYWIWDARENRITYDENRLHANAVAARVVYYQGAIMLNHISSAIHALYRVRVNNKKQVKTTAWNLQFDATPPSLVHASYRARLSISF